MARQRTEHPHIMKASEANFLALLQQPKQFLIPIFQRTYSWEKIQCEQIWKDIMRVGRDETASAHFIGSVVYIAKGIYSATSIPQLLVIDGQQRLTTLTLLLTAVSQSLSHRSTDFSLTKKKIENYYLFNNEEEGDFHYKLILTRADKETLIRIMENKPVDGEIACHVQENFSYFSNAISSLTDDGLRTLIAGIQKLVIVDISLDKNHDNPQLIFESMNATALKLTQSDLIRNFVLLGLDPKEQTDLYNDHWFPIEQGFSGTEWFDWFVRDYLTAKLGSIPNIGDIYSDFKSYVSKSFGSGALCKIPDIVSELHRYANHFVKFARYRESDAETLFVIKDLNSLRIDVARPYLLQIYEHHTNGILTQSDILSILKLIENYVFRRAICGIPTNSLNKTFAGLDHEIDKSNYVNDLARVIATKNSYRRFPSDEEFKQQFKVKDVYNFRTRNYLFRKLENYNTKEPVQTENYTIEHILPQNSNLRAEWKADLGKDWKEIQARWLHTIGNLTLTGYNSEYSDKPFSEKRQMKDGFNCSPLFMNESVRRFDCWNEQSIQQRADLLAEKAVEIWPFPTIVM